MSLIREAQQGGYLGGPDPAAQQCPRPRHAPLQRPRHRRHPMHGGEAADQVLARHADLGRYLREAAWVQPAEDEAEAQAIRQRLVRSLAEQRASDGEGADGGDASPLPASPLPASPL